MAGIVSRRPLVGVAAGSIIGALGLLLLGIGPAAGGRGLAGLLFKVAGWFFLFVSAMAFLGAFLSFRNKRSSPGSAQDRSGRTTGA
jgi:hypothetical protein